MTRKSRFVENISKLSSVAAFVRDNAGPHVFFEAKYITPMPEEPHVTHAARTKS